MRSVTHSWFGAEAVKLRFTRSGERGARRRVGGDDPAAALDAPDAGLAHQAGHLVPADVVAGPAGRLPELVGPIDRVVGLPDGDQDRDHHRVATARAESGRDLAA